MEVGIQVTHFKYYWIRGLVKGEVNVARLLLDGERVTINVAFVKAYVWDVDPVEQLQNISKVSILSRLHSGNVQRGHHTRVLVSPSHHKACSG